MQTLQKLYCDRLLYLALLLALLFFLPSAGFAESEAQLPPDQSGNVESLMAGLSDEQVRQMLIAELQKDPQAEQYTAQQKMIGPAGIFHRLLKKLSSEHDDNEEQFRNLWSGVPKVVPDLHKVFLAL